MLDILPALKRRDSYGATHKMDRCVAAPSEKARLIFEVLGGVKQALDGDDRVLEAMPWDD